MTVVLVVLVAVTLGWLLDLVAARLARHESVAAGGRGPGPEIHPVDFHRTGWPAGRLVVPGISTILAVVCATCLDDLAVLVTVVPLICLVTLLAVIDVNTRRLPNLFTVPATLVGWVLVAIAAWSGAEVRGEAVVTAIVVGIVALAVSGWWPAALGMGDAKLICAMAVLVCPLGPTAVWQASAGGLLLSGAFSVLLIISGRRHFGRTIAAGPFLAAGAVLSVLIAA